MSGKEPKTCASCGRRMTPRRRWSRSWDEVRYCSRACRRRRVTAVDRDLENSILEILSQRGPDATICPSEAARHLADADWRRLLEPARRAARRLVARGRLEMVQRGRAVDPSTAKGPIRLRRPRAAGDRRRNPPKGTRRQP